MTKVKVNDDPCFNKAFRNGRRYTTAMITGG